MSLVSDPSDRAAPVDGRAAAVSAALRRAARQSRAPIGFVSGGGGFRARKGDRIYRGAIIAGFVLIAALPILGSGVYFALIASDQYATETRFALRGGDVSALDSLSGVVGLPASRQNLDSQAIVNFIPSRAMAERLDQAIALRRVYSRSDVDWISRFNPARPIEDLALYWKSHVDVDIDQRSSIISVRARAFTPDDSLALAKQIETLSEKLVNDMTARSRDDALRNARRELDRSEAALSAATAAMRDARNETGVVDAGASAAAVEKMVGELRLQQARLSQQAEVFGRSLGPDTPQMRNLDRQIEGIKDQISRLRSESAAASGADRNLAGAMGALGQRQVDLDIAQRQYANAAVQYESARLDVESQKTYLVEIAGPSLAQKAMYPKRWWSWALIAGPAFLLWSLLAGLATLVRDHMAG